MFFKKSKVVLNESTTAAIELCRQAISLSIGSSDFIVKTVMKIHTEELKDLRLKVSVSTKFLHQNKVFDFNFEATMVKRDFWILQEGVYTGSATINNKYKFNFKSAGYLKFDFVSLVDNIYQTELKEECNLA